MSSEFVLLEKSAHVATVTLNQPETLNAITFDMNARLTEVMDDVAHDPDVRAVLLTGAGRGFCAGANLMGESGETIAAGGLRFREYIKSGNNFLTGITEMEKPWLAVVNGPAVGAGCGLALACDLVLAAESAFFAVSFTGVGAVLDLGLTYWLPRLVGVHRANELAFFGDRVYAPQAAAMGLINHAVPDDELMDTARKWAARLAAGPTLAIGAIKLGIRRGLHGSFRDSLHWEAMMQSLVLQTPDANEGIAAFSQRRKPEFKGLID